jgi:5-methyltetrahydrofolate--homocysteine methyltransferase
MADLTALTAAIEAGDRHTATRLTQEAIDAGVGPQEILDAMTRAMTEVGRRFACNEGVYVPEMLISARAMRESSELLEPLLVAEGIRPEHTAVLGTVQGDLHDIGKNLVGMMLKGAHFEVVDLGTNVPPARFAEAAREHDAHLVGISALLTTTMVGMRDAVQAIREAGLADVRIIVGGAPVTDEYAVEIGADGYARDAATAANVARELLAGSAGSGT